MLKDPEGFLQEKLSKKALSANTIRDLLMALILLTLQKKEQAVSVMQDPEAWRALKTVEIRENASRAFAGIGAPFEYPSRTQLIEACTILKKEYGLDRLPPQLLMEFEAMVGNIFSKISEP